MARFQITNEDQGHDFTHIVEAIDREDAIKQFKGSHYGRITHCEQIMEVSLVSVGERKIDEAILRKMIEAERKAIDALSRYKFLMFGYWCGVWVHMNKLSPIKVENPFREFVHLAKRKRRPQ